MSASMIRTTTHHCQRRRGDVRCRSCGGVPGGSSTSNPTFHCGQPKSAWTTVPSAKVIGHWRTGAGRPALDLLQHQRFQVRVECLAPLRAGCPSSIVREPGRPGCRKRV